MGSQSTDITEFDLEANVFANLVYDTDESFSESPQLLPITVIKNDSEKRRKLEQDICDRLNFSYSIAPSDLTRLVDSVMDNKLSGAAKIQLESGEFLVAINWTIVKQSYQDNKPEKFMEFMPILYALELNEAARIIFESDRYEAFRSLVSISTPTDTTRDLPAISTSGSIPIHYLILPKALWGIFLDEALCVTIMQSEILG